MMPRWEWGLGLSIYLSRNDDVWTAPSARHAGKQGASKRTGGRERGQGGSKEKSQGKQYHLAKTEAGFLVRVHPDPCLILIRAQIRAWVCALQSKFIRAQTSTLPVLDKKKRPQVLIHVPLTFSEGSLQLANGSGDFKRRGWRHLWEEDCGRI
jgi:hypothetical protein